MKIIKKLSELKIKFFFCFFSFFPIKRNKIILCNYLGKGYGCNPKYIAEEILNRKLKWDLVWLVTNLNTPLPSGIRPVRYGSLRSIYELSTAGVWIDNQRKLPYIRKRKKQYFIETWHGGGGPMKKIGADNPRNLNDKPYKKTSEHMNRIVNLMISNSECCTKIYRSAFLYTGEILECGYPRNDILVGDLKKAKEKVYEFFSLKKDIKTILYAPTYRYGRNLDKYQLDEPKLLNVLKQYFSGSWVLLKRLHPTMIQKAEKICYDESILNASVYDDMQELLAGCDILISDYSSVISEFALTGKPIFLFATDVKEYAVERDFYIDYYSLPFPIAENNEQLEKNIIHFNQKNYDIKVSNYKKNIGMKDFGSASEQVVNRVINWVEIN